MWHRADWSHSSGDITRAPLAALRWRHKDREPAGAITSRHGIRVCYLKDDR